MRNVPIDRHLLEKTEHLVRASRKMAKQGSARANSFIHAQPVLSTILGVGAGFLLGMILRERD